MKTKKLIDIYRRNGTIIIHNDSADVQWLSDRASIFPLYEHPIFNVDTLCATYDINDKQAAKILFRQEEDLPEGFDYRDVIASESICERDSLSVCYKNYSVLALRTSQGIEFIDRQYLEPLSDMSDELEIYERYTTGGRLYFAIKVGLELKAIVLPVKLVDKEFISKLKELLELCQISFDNKKRELI